MANVLALAQRVCNGRQIPLSKPDALYGASTEDAAVLGELFNEVAETLMLAYTWQEIQGRHTITGDGSTTAWSLPSDFDRMDAKSKLYSSNFAAPLQKISSLDKWIELDTLTAATVHPRWIIYGGQLHIKDALATGVTVEFPYIKNTPVLDADGITYQETFDADTDTFVLNDKLLRLGVIWHWREQNGLPYAEDLESFEVLKAKLITSNKGSETLAMGRPRIPAGVTISSPFTIDPDA